jgi:hypothetical protein
MGFKRRSEQKTQPTAVSPEAFIAGLDNERRRSEAQTLLDLMSAATGEKPAMWGSSIVGFGTYHYTYASGREGDAPRAGFSPRKAALTVYCMPGFDSDLLGRLGPHKTGVACLYIRNLADVDLEVLRQIVARSIEVLAEKYPPQ